MSKSATVQARIEPKLKQQADKILDALGINASTAITLFYSQMVRQQGIPLELKMPNEATLAAIDELQGAEARTKTKRFATVDELFADLDSPASE